MNPVIVQLPEPPGMVLHPPGGDGAVMSERGILWFPEDADRGVWMQAVGVRPAEYLVLQTQHFCLHVQVFVGETALRRLPSNCLRLIYLPATGLSDERYPERFLRTPGFPHYSMRLFQDIELRQHPNEEPVLHVFSAEALNIFHTPPFLGLADAAAYQPFREWLAALVVLVNLKAEQDTLRQQMDAAKRRGELLIAQDKSKIEASKDLVDLLILSRQGKQTLSEMKETQAKLKQVSLSADPLARKVPQWAVEGAQKTSENVLHERFIPTFGEELLPQLRKRLKEIEQFAGTLVESGQEQLAAIGEDLKQHLSRPRVLALIGAFSSGKTTLLNTLLLGKDDRRAFHTQRTANTAIISEISGVKEGGKEAVTFQFRQNVEDFVLATVDEKGVEITAHENIEELQRLLHLGVLFAPQIKVTQITQPSAGTGQPVVQPFSQPAVGPGDKGQRIWHELEDVAACLAELLEVALDSRKRLPDEIHHRRYTFSGSVNQDLLRTHLIQANPPRLLEMIDLDTLEGWYEFQGWPEGVERPPAAAHGEHWTEAPTASILVELARIHLRNPLLDLTTVADTPGTGSGNNGHDSITARYLSQAEGFILLLPTDRVHHGGVREIIERLREQLDDRYHGSPALGLASVAFVVNCFPTHGKQAQLEAIEKFQRMICDTFFEGKTEDWRRRQRDPRTRNFFVVRLKGLEEGERSETLHNHPSLIPLREWIENLFRSGRYSERFNFIRNALTTDWMRAYQLLKKQQAQELQSDRDREKRITAIQAFIEDELESLAQEHLTNINDFRRGFTGLCDDVTRLMEGYSGNPVKLKPDDLRQWQRGVQTYYADVNERLERFLSWEVAESWIEEMKARLHALGVTPPPLSAPVPAEQTLPWDESYHLEITTMNRMFNEMIEGWPQGLSRVGQWFKRTFTSEDDTRVTLVRNLIAFWKREYADLWDDRLKTYLRRCEQCIKQGSLQVKRRCEEAIEAAQDTTASAARLEAIQTAIACFDGFNAERQRLLDALEKELDRGN